MFSLLTQRSLRWLGHVRCMDDGRITKDLLYGGLATGSRPKGRHVLRYKDVCKRDLKAGNINPTGWETILTSDSRSWSLVVKSSIKVREGERRWPKAASVPTLPSAYFICSNCNRGCVPNSDSTVTTGTLILPQTRPYAWRIIYCLPRQ